MQPSDTHSNRSSSNTTSLSRSSNEQLLLSSADRLRQNSEVPSSKTSPTNTQNLPETNTTSQNQNTNRVLNVSNNQRDKLPSTQVPSVSATNLPLASSLIKELSSQGSSPDDPLVISRYPQTTHSGSRLAPTRAYLTRGKEKAIQQFIIGAEKQESHTSSQPEQPPEKKVPKRTRKEKVQSTQVPDQKSDNTNQEKLPTSSNSQSNSQPQHEEISPAKDAIQERKPVGPDDSLTMPVKHPVMNRSQRPVRGSSSRSRSRSVKKRSHSQRKNSVSLMQRDTKLTHKKNTVLMGDVLPNIGIAPISISHRTLERSTSRKKRNTAHTLFRRELEREQARMQNKVVLPAPKLLHHNAPQVKVVQQDKPGRQSTIQLSEVRPFNPDTGRCLWREEDTHQFGAVVAHLTFQALLKIDDILYPNDQAPLQISRLEEMCNILNGIPYSVLTTLKKKKIYKNKTNKGNNNSVNAGSRQRSNDEMMLTRIIRTNSLYASEMEFDKERENLRIVKEDDDQDIMKNEIIANNSIQQLLQSLHVNEQNVFSRHLESLKDTADRAFLIQQQHSAEAGRDISDLPANTSLPAHSITNSSVDLNEAIIQKGPESKKVQTLAPNERKAVEGLVGRGNLSQAAKKLKDSTDTTREVDYNATIAYNTLCSLHIAEDNLSALSVEVSPTDFLNVDQYTLTSLEQMKEVLDSLNKRSAADAAGWSVALIANIISRQPAIAQLVMRMINGFIIRQYWPDFLFISRMVAIPKPNDPGKYRPITITSTWRKLASKIILKLHYSTLHNALVEGQYGVGTSYSAEIIITSLQAALDVAHSKNEGLVITQLDLTNAYNLVSRPRLLSILKDIGLHSSAQYYFLSMFTKERLFFYSSDKAQIIPNSRGVSQGEACSPILFSLYLSKVIRDAAIRAKAMWENDCSNVNSSNSSSVSGPITSSHFLHRCAVPPVLSYLDDIFLISPSVEHAQLCTTAILDDLRSVGMQPNLNKTCRLSINTSLPMSTSSSSSEIVQQTQALKVLGSVVTLEENERIAFFIRKACNALNIMLSATQLRKQSFLLIARLCIASKLVHLLRTLPLPMMLLNDFDNVTEQLIINTFALPQSAMRELIFFPQQKGGLGLTALHKIQLIAALPLQAELLKLPHIAEMTRLLNGIAGDVMNRGVSITSDTSNSRVSVQVNNDSDLNAHASSSINDSSSNSRFLSLSMSSSSSENITSRSIRNLNNRLFWHEGIDEPNDGKAGFSSLFYYFEPFTTLAALLDKKKKTVFVQHDLWVKQVEGEYQALLQQKKLTNTHQYITLLATSKDSSCSRWLRTIPFANYQKLNDEEFLHSIHYRLGVPDAMKEFVKQQDSTVFRGKKWSERGSLSSSTGERVLNCPLCGCRMGDHHYANCQTTGPIRTARHNLIKRLLASTLMQIPATTVTVEDYFAGQGYKIEDEEVEEYESQLVQQKRITQTIPDITIFVTDTKRNSTQLERTLLDKHRDSPSVIKFSLDLTIVDIHATSNEKAHMGGSIAQSAEDRKRKHYENYNQEHSVKCLPFGISSVGEFGPAARSILDFVNDMAKRHYVFINTNTLEEQIALLLETSRFEMEKSYRQELIRRINLNASFQHRMDVSASLVSPSLIEQQKGRKRTRLNGFWPRQLVNMQNFLRAKTTQNLSEQHAEELYHQLFNWIPEANKEPPDKGPPDKLAIRNHSMNGTHINSKTVHGDKTAEDSISISQLNRTLDSSFIFSPLSSNSNFVTSNMLRSEPNFRTMQKGQSRSHSEDSFSSTSCSVSLSGRRGKHGKTKGIHHRNGTNTESSDQSSASSSTYIPAFMIHSSLNQDSSSDSGMGTSASSSCSSSSSSESSHARPVLQNPFTDHLMHSSTSNSTKLSNPIQIHNNSLSSPDTRSTLASTISSSSKVLTNLARNGVTTSISNNVVIQPSSLNKMSASASLHNMSKSSPLHNESASSSLNQQSSFSSSNSIRIHSSSLTGNTVQNVDVAQSSLARKFFSPGDFFARFSNEANTQQNNISKGIGNNSDNNDHQNNNSQLSSSIASKGSQSYLYSPAIVTSHPYFAAAVSTTSPPLSHGGDVQSRISLGPSQKGVINHPVSLPAVPPYPSSSLQPHEQIGSGGRMAAPSASSKSALGQPPPTTNANPTMQ